MTRVRYEFDPFEATGVELPEGADRDEVLKQAADYLTEQVIRYMGDSVSPVAGYGRFPALSKAYKKFKTGAGHPGVPDLEFSGDLKAAISAAPTRGGAILIEVSPDQADKADGHCNLSGKSQLPTRRFIPDDTETFKKPILDGIARIIKTGGGL